MASLYGVLLQTELALITAKHSIGYSIKLAEVRDEYSIPYLQKNLDEVKAALQVIQDYRNSDAFLKADVYADIPAPF